MSRRQLRCFARGFNDSQDGPGNRLVYHLCGCNMRCPWCANPEGLDPDRTGADVYEISVSSLLDEIRSCAPLFYDGGGVTFTGGEATLQMDALLEVIPILYAEHIGAVIETNATHTGLSALFPYLQLLIADLKHPDSQRLAQVTGVQGETVYRNLKSAAAAGIPMLIRIPVIHGFNDREEDIAAFSAFFQELRRVSRAAAWCVELLPYHEFGKEKWAKLGKPYAVVDGFAPPERLRRFAEMLRAIGITEIHT